MSNLKKKIQESCLEHISNFRKIKKIVTRLFSLNENLLGKAKDILIMQAMRTVF